MERLMCAPRVRLMVPCLKVNSHAPGLVCPPFPSCTHIPVRGGTVSFPVLSLSLRPSPCVPHQTKLGCVPLRCSTRWRLRSSPRFSRRRPPPGLKATPPSNLRLRSLVRVVSLSRTILSSLISRAPASDVVDPNQECTVYSYAPVASVIASEFPPIWQPASVLSTDTTAQGIWANMSGSIPNIAPKGQLNGSTINETYNAATDTDCCEFCPFSSYHVRCGDSVARLVLFPWTRL